MTGEDEGDVDVVVAPSVIDSGVSIDAIVDIVDNMYSTKERTQKGGGEMDTYSKNARSLSKADLGLLRSRAPVKSSNVGRQQQKSSNSCGRELFTSLQLGRCEEDVSRVYDVVDGQKSKNIQQ